MTGVETWAEKRAFPAVHFYDEKTGQRYTLKGEGFRRRHRSRQTADGEKEKKATSGDRTTARENRAPRGFPRLVPASSTAGTRCGACRAEQEVRGRAATLHQKRTGCWRPRPGEQTLRRVWSRSFKRAPRSVSKDANRQGRRLVASASGGEPCARRTDKKNSGSHSRSYRAA